MKKIAVFITSILLLGCDKEFKVTSSFDFELETLYNPNITGSAPRVTEFTIIPEGQLVGTIHLFKYTITEGEGHFLDDKGVVLPQNFWVPLEELTFIFNYLPTDNGTHTVDVSIRESSGVYENSITLTYEVSGVSIFDFSGSFDESSVLSGQTVNLNFSVDETIGSSSDYTMRYVLNTGNAIIRDNLGNELVPNVYYPVPDALNGFTWQMEGTEVGTIDISFYMRNDVDFEEIIDLSIEVDPSSNFSIEVDPYPTYTPVGFNNCLLTWSSGVIFTATHIAEGTHLTFASLIRTSDGFVVDDSLHLLAVGESIVYGNLESGAEYQVEYINDTTGESIFKTFIAISNLPDNELVTCPE